MSDKKLSDQELRELENALDDGELIKRIRNVVMGDTHPDLEGETVEEQSVFILQTISRQLRSGNLSSVARGYIACCLERHLDGSTKSLDEAFYTKHHKASGGQPVSSKVERDVVRAYRSVIRRDTQKTDTLTGIPIYELPSKTTLKQAKQAALKAYRIAKNKNGEDFEPDKKIHQTITYMLKRLGVLM